MGVLLRVLGYESNYIVPHLQKAATHLEPLDRAVRPHDQSPFPQKGHEWSMVR
jgi:hypothetical protein